MFIYFHESLISLDDLIFATALGDDIILYNRQGGNRISCLNHFDAAKAIQELYDILIAKGYAEADAGDLQISLDDDELAALDEAAEAGYQWIASATSGNRKRPRPNTWTTTRPIRVRWIRNGIPR